MAAAPVDDLVEIMAVSRLSGQPSRAAARRKAIAEAAGLA
jgi:hypothetical protein